MALVGAILAPTSGLRADGDEFFGPEEIPGKPEYVVVGSVKDDRGHYVSTAVVTVEVEDPVLIYQTTTNVVGRYRTVDIGRAASDLGYELDPARVKVSVSAPGYILMRQFKRDSPRRKHGAVEIEFLMKKEK